MKNEEKSRGEPSNKPVEKPVYYKVEQCGHICFVLTLEQAPIKNNKQNQQKKDESEIPSWILEDNEKRRRLTREENEKYNAIKSRNEFKKTVLNNFNNNDKFLTLTFAPTNEIDITNVEHTNKEFKKFIQRMKRRYGDFKYAVVIEFQDGETWKKKGVDKQGRGAVHYHMLMHFQPKENGNQPYIPANDIAEIWRWGFIGINSIEGNDNLGAYMSKYMAKDLRRDSRLKGKKGYWTSRNVEKPRVYIGGEGSDAHKIVEQFKQEGYIPIQQREYDTEYHGRANRYEFNKMRKDGILKRSKLKDERNIKGESERANHNANINNEVSF